MKVIGPFKQILTMRDLPLKGSLKDEQLEVVSDGGILIDGSSIKEVRDFETLAKRSGIEIEKLDENDGPLVALPGFVDSHTHICFGGTRARDYALRNAGATYLEIAKAGGGIWDTVSQTRKASQQELTAGIEKRALRHLKRGVTTIEVKSGYGLSVKEELKMLRAIKTAGNIEVGNKEAGSGRSGKGIVGKADLVATCLAAHIFPKDYDGDINDYLAEIIEKLFPLLKSENLANRVDAFIEEEAYSAAVIAPYFEGAKKLGFDLTVHADQFHTGGSAVAVRYDAVSADHLEASGNAEIELLAKSNVIATALPGATLGLGCPFTPARKILDAGGAVAIASDWNPGSGPMGDLLTGAALIGAFEKLSNAEVLAGITFRAAATLRLTDRGYLTAGTKADIVAFPTDHYNEILYHQGQLKPTTVWKSGQKI